MSERRTLADGLRVVGVPGTPDRTNPSGTTGTVALVGAGPGDPELLTVRAYRLLRHADVVLHDQLVSDDILALTDARRIDVGKIGGGRATSQDLINRLLLSEARDGRRVVRLKGGDPFVFGRGGEEMEFLARHGVPVEVVPGVSSAVAAASSAGIPVTHRGVSTHFSVVTAVGSRDECDDTLRASWRALAAAGGTVVFLMGLRRLEAIVDEVLAAGVSPERPMAVVSAATTDDERTVVGTVATLVDRVRTEAIATPAVVILGDVVALRDRLVPAAPGPLPLELAALVG